MPAQESDLPERRRWSQCSRKALSTPVLNPVARSLV
jgi:hypothetical protein